MHLFSTGLLAVLCIPVSWALQESEVGVVDWHKSLIGVPRTVSLSTSPTFHRVGEETTQSVLLTATERNVLAALDPVNGSLAWRYIFEPPDTLVQFRKHKNVVVALSGAGGATLRSFNALSGQLLIEKRLHPPESGRMSTPVDLGTEITFLTGGDPTKRPDMVVLTNGHTVRRIEGSLGDIKWNWTSQDQSTQFIISNLIATPTTVYLIGLEKSTTSHTLHITTLSATTGEVVATTRVPSHIAHGFNDVIALSHANSSSTDPVVAWLQQGVLFSFSLTPKLKGKPTSIKGSAYKSFMDVGLRDHGQFIAVKPDGSTRAFKLGTDGSGLSSFWDFADSAPSPKYAGSLYAGGVDHDGWPYIARIHWSFVIKKASVDILCAHLADGKGLNTGFSIPFETNVHGIITHIAIDAANPEGWKVLTRMVVTTTTGAVQLWQQDQVQWTREESLASISVAEFVELPEKKITSSHVGEGQETFISRLNRQLSDAQDFPEYVVNFAKRFATGSYDSVSSSASSSAQTGPLSRDAFGFRQIIVVATPFGKIYGIDSSNGNILWSRVLGLGWAAEVGGRIIPLKLFVTRTVSDGNTPEVVLVTQRKADNSLIDTVVFHLDALTGEDVRNVSRSGDILQGLDIISGPLLETFLFREGEKAVILIDEFLQAHLYPDTSAAREAFMKTLPLLHFPLRAGPQRVMGHQIAFVEDLGNKVVAYPTWSLTLGPEENIQTMFPSMHGPVASVGKVLGNKTTLYKYLNPRLFVLLTESTSASPSTCGIHLVDTVTGNIIYSTTVPASSSTCDVKATLTENWLVYHYFEESFAAVGGAKGYRMVSVELYEGEQIDDKTMSSDMSSHSKQILNVTAIERAYVFPHGITAISTTSTKFGITAKDIIVANNIHQIQSYSRRFLDPRRPDRKVTAAEQEEFLIQYEPVLPNDPRRVLSHNYEVAKTEQIVTSPALLESTSLVFAYGLDLFMTRIAPSNTFDVLSESFNKVQLILTVSGLAVAIMVTKPMVARKRLRERWYS